MHPVNVRVYADPPETEAPAPRVTMIDADPGADAVAVPKAIVTLGTTLVSKKPDGYDTVICDEAIKLVAATKLTVTGTLAFAATLSEGATTNDAMVTCPPMLPEFTPELAKSLEV